MKKLLLVVVLVLVAEYARADALSETYFSVDSLIATSGLPDQVYTVGDTTYLVYGGRPIPTDNVIVGDTILQEEPLRTCKSIFTIKKNRVVGAQRKC